MKSIALPAGIAAALILAATSLAGPAQKKKPKATVNPKPSPVIVEKPCNPKTENQFITVDEFQRAGRPPSIPVSVEGYAVLGYRPLDGSIKMVLVDSVDHVLNTEDANRHAAAGAPGGMPLDGIKKHPGWTWADRQMLRFIMYIGPGTAQKELHDVIPKLRVTGWVTKGRPGINPITKVEFMDDNGDWRALP